MALNTDIPFEPSKAQAADIVLIDFTELSDGTDLSDRIKKAYGEDGLGILLVQNVPGLAPIRQALLTSAFRLGNLSEETLSKYEYEKTNYSVGWSRGKEKLAKDLPDYAKGSWYGNPLFNQPTMNERLINQHPAFYHPNVWPKELPTMENEFLTLGRKVVSVGTQLARHCDSYCSSCTKDYPKHELENITSLSLTHKARLLYYYPFDALQKYDMSRADSWCGWHNDHGALTGLCIGQFMDSNGKFISNPEPSTAGLFIKNRQGDIVKVSVPQPSTTLAFQIGETSQIQTGGLLKATPHAVMGTKAPGVSRATFAVFMEPNHSYTLTIPDSRTVVEATSDKNLPRNVPSLYSRWGDTKEDSFNNFSNRTFAKYYEMLDSVGPKQTEADL